MDTGLLKTTRIVGILAVALNAAFIVFAAGVLLGLWVFADRIPFDAIGRFAGADIDGRDAVRLAAVLLVGGMVVSALAVLALQQVLRIVESVISGDPFAPENGERWTRVGWLALAVQAVDMAQGPIVERVAPKIPVISNSPGSLTGIMMVLLIFVVAQIFRRGTRMQQEIEGTV